MKEVLQFIERHYEIIFSCFAAIFSLIMFLIKKKPIKIVDSVKTAILSSVPGLIVDAESKFGSGHGIEKFNFVFDSVVNMLKATQPGIEVELYYWTIKKAIEDILATPQKKEEKVNG